MERHLLIILFVLTGTLSALRRDIQKQVDRLERRYEQDYVTVKETMRDLWNSLEHASAACCVKEETATSVKTADHSTDDDTNDNTVPPVAVTDIILLSRGLSEEKEFVRTSFNDLTDSIVEVQNNCVNSVEQKMSYMSIIDATCSSVEIEMKQLREQHAELKDTLQRTNQRTKEELEGLRLVINEAMEEVMQKSVLDRPSSCMDMAKNGVSSSGVYTLYYQLQPFVVYCMISKSGGYTFISPETYINVNINEISNDNSHVIIRHRRTNGWQYESRIEQITRYKTQPISVQYNAHTGYTGVVNSQMTPYIYVGLNPTNLEGRNHRGDLQGYRSNGKDITFVNCDGNPNGYFAFLFNHNKVSTSSKGQSPAIARKWIDTATRLSDDLIPDKFLSFFELHFGGCGAYATTNHFHDVTGAAVGIPYILS